MSLRLRLRPLGLTLVLAATSACSMPYAGRMDDGSQVFRGSATPTGATWVSPTGEKCVSTGKGRFGTISCDDGRTGTYTLDEEPMPNAFEWVTGIGAIGHMSGSGKGVIDGEGFTFVWGPTV